MEKVELHLVKVVQVETAEALVETMVILEVLEVAETDMALVQEQVVLVLLDKEMLVQLFQLVIKVVVVVELAQLVLVKMVVMV